MPETAFSSAGRLAAELRERRIGCRDLLELYLTRVERLNPKLNAVILLDAERARARAREADAALARGEVWGPLHGLPMTVKESYDIAGLPTTWGVPALAGNIAASDAVVVARLRRAGAIIFGKSNVPLLLGDFQSYNAVYGTTNNPWDATRVPGGSSGGGAAALAAGLTALEAGSDIGGSIRFPPHYCGIYGHKPTWGIVPPRGHALPGRLAPADLSVVGPMARSAEDLALVLGVIAGADEALAAGWRLDLPPARCRSLRGCRVAVWLADPHCPVDDAVSDRLQNAVEALARAGARIDDAARPAIDATRSHHLFLQMMAAEMSARGTEEDFAAAQRKTAALAPNDESDAAQSARGTVQSHRAWLIANQERTRLRLAWRAFFADWDVLLCPIAATTAFPHNHSTDWAARRLVVNGKPEPYDNQLFWTGLTGLSYLPATAAPAGLSPAGLPVGIQIAGPEFGDLTTIEFARLLGREIGGFAPPPGYA